MKNGDLKNGMDKHSAVSASMKKEKKCPRCNYPLKTIKRIWKGKQITQCRYCNMEIDENGGK